MNPKDTYVEIAYTNHKGKLAIRKIEPLEFYYGTSAFHKEPQWLCIALDLEKQEKRVFALNKVTTWKKHEPEV